MQLKMGELARPAPSADDIAKEIAAAIVAHKLPPGTRLREEAGAGVYQVSRPQIRAALLMLSKDKLINIVPDKGARVRGARHGGRLSPHRRASGASGTCRRR